MAVVNREEQKKRKEAVAINPFDAALKEGQTVTTDTEADAWAVPQPPVKGVYRVKLFVPANNGYRQNETDSGEIYFQANIEARILDKVYVDVPVFDTVSTIVGRGKGISTMAALLVKGGQKVPKEATSKQILQQFATWIKGEPILYIDTDWQVWSKNANNGKGKALYTSMKDVPQKPDGTPVYHWSYRHSDGTSEEVTAKCKVKKWYTKDEAVANGYGGKGEGKPVVKVVEEVEEEEEAPAPTKVAKEEVKKEEVKKKKKTPPPPPEEDEEEEDDEDMVDDDEDED